MPPPADPIADPLDTFINARGFLRIANVADVVSSDPVLIWPKIVCVAFALELHIKCLAGIRGRRLKGHDVRKLFGKLDQADREYIEARHAVVVSTHPHHASAAVVGVPMDAQSVLTRMALMFEKGRYWHERKMPHRDALGFAGTPGADSLSDAIRDRIIELRPDYPTQAEARANSLIGMLIEPI